MNKKSLNIAIAAEIAPAKTIIPVLDKLKELDANDKLNFKIGKIIALYHGLPAKDLLQLRRSLLNIDTIKKLIKDIKIDSINVHVLGVDFKKESEASV